jgi:hypothetical protein
MVSRPSEDAMVVRNWVTGFVVSALTLTLGACGSSSGDNTGNAVGPAGCSQAPDCSKCGQCFDTCLCSSGDADACLAQCTGAGGASTGGTGNVGGGTGGTPTGGAGGGTGGLPSGGTGGGSGGGSGGGNCSGLQTGSAQCDACLQSTCCAQVAQCLSNQACLGLIQCLSQYCSQTSNVQTCAQQYCGQYLSGANDYNAISQCAQSSCPACG